MHTLRTACLLTVFAAAAGYAAGLHAGTAGPEVCAARANAAARDGASPANATATVFSDDFENGLDLWRFPQGRGYRPVDTGDASHGRALALGTASLQTHALMRGSEAWPDVRIEGEVLFPHDVHNYLGFIYRYVDDGRRIDFGSLYIKGNGSYLQANPHRDSNVGRTVYPERRATLDGAAAIEIGKWQRFALEVVGAEAHLHVGGSEEPQLTLCAGEAASGAFGFKPRHPGGQVWIDNIRVRRIAAFSYHGPPRPDVPYARDAFVTEWQVLGPLTRTSDEVEAGYAAGQTVVDDGRRVAWRPFRVDYRGAVLTGQVTEYRGARRVAYFHAELDGDAFPGKAELQLSTADALAIWLDGEFAGFTEAMPAAWWDAPENPDHPPTPVTVELHPGTNHLVIRAIGGVYATGGFYLRTALPTGDR